MAAMTPDLDVLLTQMVASGGAIDLCWDPARTEWRCAWMPGRLWRYGTAPTLFGAVLNSWESARQSGETGQGPGGVA